MTQPPSGLRFPHHLSHFFARLRDAFRVLVQGQLKAANAEPCEVRGVASVDLKLHVVGPFCCG